MATLQAGSANSSGASSRLLSDSSSNYSCFGRLLESNSPGPARVAYITRLQELEAIYCSFPFPYIQVTSSKAEAYQPYELQVQMMYNSVAPFTMVTVSYPYRTFYYLEKAQ